MYLFSVVVRFCQIIIFNNNRATRISGCYFFNKKQKDIDELYRKSYNVCKRKVTRT